VAAAAADDEGAFFAEGGDELRDDFDAGAPLEAGFDAGLVAGLDAGAGGDAGGAGDGSDRVAAGAGDAGGSDGADDEDSGGAAETGVAEAADARTTPTTSAPSGRWRRRLDPMWGVFPLRPAGVKFAD
jgi:hypothetical protein